MIALALLACSTLPAKDGDSAAPDDLTLDGLEVSRAAIETVLRVRWSTAEAVRADVRVTFGDETLVVPEAEATTKHDVLVVGVPANTEVVVRVEADGTDATATATALTGALPAWVPDLTYTAEVPEAAHGGITLTPVFFASGGGILGIDGKGRVVWSWPPEDAGLAGPPFRTWRSLDGKAVLFNHPAPDAESTGPVFRISLDGGEQSASEIVGQHTDFVEYTPGGYLALGWDIRDVGDGRRILGDTIREYAPDGTQRVVWSVWDDYTPDLARTYEQLYAADPTVEDWSHINGIAYDPATDDVYVTTTFNNAVIRVARETGEQVWCLSDFACDYANADGTDRIVLPHSVQPLDGGVLVFSRGMTGVPDTCSAAVELALDETRAEARETWRFQTDDCLFVPYLGGAERLSGGNTLIAWTSGGRLDEVTPEGEIAWQVSTAIGSAFGFSTRVDRLGP